MNTNSGPAADFAARSRELIEAGRLLYQRGWVPATSGNFSARLANGDIAITVSGRHKGMLAETDLMAIDRAGNPRRTGLRSSAETLLHTALYERYPEAGAVLHTHSVNGTLLSRHLPDALVLEGYELLKAFPGIETHESRLVVPIFPNDQDIPQLCARVDAWLDGNGAACGYLIAGHGLYTWGRDVAETLRHLEAFEFLFQCELEARKAFPR